MKKKILGIGLALMMILSSVIGSSFFTGMASLASADQVVTEETATKEKATESPAETTQETQKEAETQEETSIPKTQEETVEKKPEIDLRAAQQTAKQTDEAKATVQTIVAQDLNERNEYDLANLQTGVQKVIISTGKLVLLKDTRPSEKRTLVNVVIKAGAGVNVQQGTSVDNIVTETNSGEKIKNIIVQGTANNIRVTKGTQVEFEPYTYIGVGTYNSGTVNQNVTIEDNVKVTISGSAKIAIGANISSTIKGDINVGNNVVIRETTSGGADVAIGANSKSKINNINVGSNIDIDIAVGNGVAVIGVRGSNGNNVTVGPNSKIRYRKPSSYGGGQGVAIGAAGNSFEKAQLNNVTMQSNPRRTDYYNIDMQQGLGVGAYSESTVNNVTVGNNIRIHSFDTQSFHVVYIGAISSFTPAVINGNVKVGNDVWLSSSSRADLGIGAYSSTINGDVIIGEDLSLDNALIGIGVLATNGASKAKNFTIGDYSYVNANTLGIGSYSGNNKYPATMANLNIGNSAYVESVSTGVGALGKDTTMGSITIGNDSNIKAGRVGVGAVNAAVVDGDINIGEYSNIMASGTSKHFTAVGSGYEERILQSKTQKVNGNIFIMGSIFISYSEKNAEFPIINLVNNPDGTIFIEQGNVGMTKKDSMVLEALDMDRQARNTYGETVLPRLIDDYWQAAEITVPAKGDIPEYQNIVNTLLGKNSHLIDGDHMVAYLPDRELELVETTPAKGTMELEQGSRLIGFEFNGDIGHMGNILDQEGRGVGFYVDGEQVGFIELNWQSYGTNRFYLLGGRPILWVSAGGLNLPMDKEITAKITSGALTDVYGFMTNTEEVELKFIIPSGNKPEEGTEGEDTGEAEKPEEKPIENPEEKPTEETLPEGNNSETNLPAENNIENLRPDAQNTSIAQSENNGQQQEETAPELALATDQPQAEVTGVNKNNSKEIVEIDPQDVPLKNANQTKNKWGLWLIASLAALAGTSFMIFILWRRRKKE